ncbi:MAG: efflux RND transporter periplasmic adaptor subunit [Clostridia bacterium]|nr:efflux RND transporter periplasmic adaptor subunit [Clostridia bacterium]
MNKKLISLMAALTLVVSFAGCGKEETAPVTTTATNVAIQAAKIGDIQSSVSYTGDIKAATTASVTPKTSGTVKAVYAEIGDYVNAGSVLLKLDTSTYQLAYNQSKAAYNSAQAAYNNAVAAYNNVKNGSNAQSKVSMNQSVASAQSNYDTALDNYNRQKALFDIGSISQVALDSAKTALDNAKLALDTAKASANLNSSVIAPQSEASAKAGVEQAKAAVEQAKAAMDIAANNVANCTVTSPISGYIASKNVQIGQTASQGMEAFSIKNTNSLEVEINVTEAVISHINIGSQAKINIKAAELENLTGTVTVAGEAKNDATGMFTVKISIPNSNDKVKVGMIADVLIATDTANNVLTIPQNSLLQSGDEYYVYVAQGETAVKKVVTTGISDENNIQILSGLAEGELVITDGKEFLSETNNLINITEN